MDISSLTAGAGASAAMTDEERMNAEKEGFLKLLIAQMSNQDPLDPQDSDKYVQQFTQFSQLEQMMNLNKGVENISVGQLSNNTQEAVRFVGRDVVAKGSSLIWDENGPGQVRYMLPQEAETFGIQIFDEEGELVRQDSLPTSVGQGAYNWDGYNDAGELQMPGRYQISVEALDADGEPIVADTYVRGRVAGVRFDAGYPELVVDGRRLKMSEITEVH